MSRDEMKIAIGGAGVTAERSETGSRPVAELSLLRRVAKKDRAAFELLYHVYYPRLFSYLFRTLRRIELVEETVNDVMLAVWHSAASFREESLVSTWILGIAYRQSLKALRRTATQPTLVSPSSLENVADIGEDTARKARELHLALSAALEQLSPEHRAVVELTYYYGYSYREIAAIVLCSENTVKSRMFYARRRLRDLLERSSSETTSESKEKA